MIYTTKSWRERACGCVGVRNYSKVRDMRGVCGGRAVNFSLMPSIVEIVELEVETHSRSPPVIQQH